jgi:chromosome condensin MukBEF ATPase and DNA-binding subunit MukB
LSPAAANDSRPAPDLRALSDAIAALEAQVQTLSAQMADLRKQQQESSEEASRLRQELAQTKAQLDSKMKEGATLASSATPTYAAASSTSETSSPSPVASSNPAPQNATAADAPKEQSVEERVGRLEENQQMIDGKLDDQYQTKIESGSKYRVRLSGVDVESLYLSRTGG